MNATALWMSSKCEVWCPTQNAEAALAAVAAAAELPLDKCDVYRRTIGGGFGRRSSSQDYAVQAVLIAKQIPGVPVKLIWSREEDMAHGRYHPVTMAKLTGALDEQGNLTALHIRISGQSILSTLMPQRMVGGMDPVVFQGLAKDDPEKPTANDQATCYSVPNLLVEHAMRNPPVPPGFWRGVNVNQNAIYIECFMDELAQAAKIDALEFRRRLLGNQPKALAVLEAVAERGGWGKPLPEGVMGRGLSLFRSFGSYTAALAEVSVHGGKLKVHRIVGATDFGLRGQSAPGRDAGGRLIRLRPGRHVPRDHHQGRQGSADQFRYLPAALARRDAEGRKHYHAVQRLVGRRWRAHHCGGRAGSSQCGGQCHRQAHQAVAG